MKTIDLSQELQVRVLGFNIPCRQFIIEAQVTRDRRMPMVDEYVLRALKLCEKVSIKRLTGFFGFSQMEMQVVLSDLNARSLINMEDNFVTLHPSANELFRTAVNGHPQIIEVEGWVNRIWFDLISKSMIASHNLRNVKNLIELRPLLDKEGLHNEYARKAFELNFKDYLRNIRKINNPDHLNLYAVTSVSARRFSYAQVTGHQLLRYDPEPKTETMLHIPEVDRTQQLQELTDAMTQTLGQYSDPEPSVYARTEFSRLTGSDSLLTSSTGEFVNLHKWFATENSRVSAHVHVFIGSSYLERNQRSFSTLLERSPGIKKLRDEDSIELMWFRPGGSLWGTSEDLRSTIAELRSSIRKNSGCNPNIRSTLCIPASVRREQQRRFGNIFDEGFNAPAGLVSPSIEILLIRGIGALISVLVPLSSAVKIWVGQMTVRDEDLARIEKLIRGRGSESFEKIWPRGKSSDKKQAAEY